MSRRPPPPLPPSCSDAARTSATASKRVGQVLGDADDDAGLAVLGDADDGDDAGADARLGLVGQALQILHLDAADGARQQLRAGDVADRVLGRPAAAHGELLARLGQLAVELAALLDQRRRGGSRASAAGTLSRPASSCRRRDSALSWRRACVPVIASSRRTPAATAPSPTTLTRPISPVRPTWVPPQSSIEKALPCSVRAHRDDADLVAVFLAEERAGAGCDRLVDAHQPGRHRLVAQHDRVGDLLDLGELARPRSAWDGEKSKRSRSGATSEPFCAT